MSEQRIINELREIKLELREIKKLLSSSELPVNEQEAAAKLGVSATTLQNNFYKKKLEGTYTINRLGKRQYFLSKLLGIGI